MFKVFLAVLGHGALSVVVSYFLVRNRLLSSAGTEQWAVDEVSPGTARPVLLFLHRKV